jgi:hypothetical protein
VTFHVSRDYVVVCFFDGNEMERKGSELSTEVKIIAWKLLHEVKRIAYVSETLSVPRSTIASFKKHAENHGSVENCPRRGRKLATTGNLKGL